MTTLLDFLHSAEPVNNVWNYVSSSRLNLWMKCPLAFKRRYIEGVISPQNQNLFIGKVVHKVLEQVYTWRTLEKVCDESTLLTFIESGWNHVMEEEPFDFDDNEQSLKCCEVISALVKTYIAETDVANEIPLAIEKRFETPLIDSLTGEDFGIPLVGIVDLVLRDTNGAIIIDFKTASSTSGYCEIQHEIQLTAYAYLVRQLLDREETGLEIRQLVKTKVPKIVVHHFPPRSDEHFKRFFDLVREYLDSLDRGVFNYRPSWNCGMCEHSGCCIHQQ